MTLKASSPVSDDSSRIVIREKQKESIVIRSEVSFAAHVCTINLQIPALTSANKNVRLTLPRTRVVRSSSVRSRTLAAGIVAES